MVESGEFNEWPDALDLERAFETGVRTALENAREGSPLFWRDVSSVSSCHDRVHLFSASCEVRPGRLPGVEVAIGEVPGSMLEGGVVESGDLSEWSDAVDLQGSFEPRFRIALKCARECSPLLGCEVSRVFRFHDRAHV